MIKKINYANKQAFQNNDEIPENQKVTDTNMNDIKDVVNSNAEELDKTQKKITTVTSAPLTYKGSVTQFSDLQELENVKNGDIYSVTSENKNYIFAVDEWTEYTPEIDISELEAQTEELGQRVTNLENITRQVTSIVTDAEITQNTNYTVPQYVLGNNSLEVFLKDVS